MVRIGFSTTEAVISRIIRGATGGKVSHAFLTYPDSFLGIDLVLEADWKGTVFNRLDAVLQSTEVVALITPVVPLEPGTQWVVKNFLGCPYDYEGLLGMVGVLACEWLHRHPRNLLANPNGLFCSDLVDLAMRHSGYPGTTNLDPKCVSPEKLLEFLLQGGALHELKRAA